MEPQKPQTYFVVIRKSLIVENPTTGHTLFCAREEEVKGRKRSFGEDSHLLRNNFRSTLKLTIFLDNI